MKSLLNSYSYIKIRKLSQAPYWAIPKIGFDLVLWVLLTFLALWIDQSAWTLVTLFLIGAVPMHDLLVHGHDGTHRLISRNRPANEFFTWFNHALVGISGTAYRSFHFDHHKKTHTKDDPEYRLILHLSGGKGWGYLLLPLVSHLSVNAYPFYTQKLLKIRWRVFIDLFGILILHVGLYFLLGQKIYLTFILAPIFTGLATVVVLRSICEHHFAVPASSFTQTRGIKTSRLLEFFWSNTNYHLEHHLFPSVPFQKMPELRAFLKEEYQKHGALLDQGYLKTGLSLLKESEHFRRKTS